MQAGLLAAYRKSNHDLVVDAAQLEASIIRAREARVLHWPLTFPQVFQKGGFDCVLGNPPWERIKLQEEEFFASENRLVAQAKNKAERQQRIERELATRVVALLEPVVGPGHVRVNVSARLDIQSQEETEERWDPTTVVRSPQASSDGHATTAAACLAHARAHDPPTASTPGHHWSRQWLPAWRWPWPWQRSCGRAAGRSACLLYTSPSPRDRTRYRMPSSA